MQILPFYAAVLALFFVVLSARTITLRRKLKIAVGDNGNPHMLRAMRVHANFAEYIPFALLLIYFVEIQSGPVWLIHLMGVMLVVGRALHSFGVSQVQETFKFRVIGMVMTLTTLILASLYLLFATLIH